MQLDKTTARSINFVFGIVSILSLGIVNFDILLGMIVFYILQVNILFLLYLADMDNLGALFNNLINEIVQSNHLYQVIC